MRRLGLGNTLLGATCGSSKRRFISFLFSSSSSSQSDGSFPFFPVKYAQLIRMAVATGHQRLGIGQRLMEAALAACAERGIDDVRLRTSFYRRRAIAFYERHGFRVVRREWNTFQTGWIRWFHLPVSSLYYRLSDDEKNGRVAEKRQ